MPDPGQADTLLRESESAPERMVIMHKVSMKFTLSVLAGVWLAFSGAQAIEEGDLRVLVIDELGDPRGSFTIGSREILQYDRGLVTLEGGKVASHDIISAEEATRRIEERARREAEAAKARAEKKAERIKAGTERKEALLANEEFMDGPVSDRIKTWTKFQKNYPEVNIAKELAEARNAQQAIDAKNMKEEKKKMAAQEAEKLKRLSTKKRRKYLRGKKSDTE